MVLLSFRTPEADPFTALGPISGGSDPTFADPTLASLSPAPASPARTARVIYGPPLPGSDATPTPATTSAPATDAAATARPTHAQAAAAASATGQAVQTPYGLVQVQVSIADGKIVDVTALQLPQDDRHSRRISQLAEPLLRQEAITAQSARIDVLSGATYTSMGYARSLQSALDKAKA